MSAFSWAAAGTVFLDAYDGVGGIPAHLRNPEFLKDCCAALMPGGAIIANLFNGVPGSRARRDVAEYAQCLQEAIGGEVYSFKVWHKTVIVMISIILIEKETLNGGSTVLITALGSSEKLVPPPRPSSSLSSS
jgi:hypothetical protein